MVVDSGPRPTSTGLERRPYVYRSIGVDSLKRRPHERRVGGVVGREGGIERTEGEHRQGRVHLTTRTLPPDTLEVGR